MSYNDFWFIDTRIQTRNLRRWLIWFILVFAFVSIGSILAIKTMYHDIKKYEIQANNPTVTVLEAKATNVNGYIRGEVKNEEEEEIVEKYILFLLYDKNNELIGTEYLCIENLGIGQIKTYELKFKRNNVDSFFVTIVDQKEDKI